MGTRHTTLITALDLESTDAAKSLVDTIGEHCLWYKVGFRLFCEEGPSCVRFLKERGKKVFLDLKFHDIPNTVATAIEACADYGVDMLNVHASGGSEMLRAAAAAVRELKAAGKPAPLLIAVTVLTSLDAPGLGEALNRADGYSPAQHVPHLALLAKTAGLDGVVCSAQEISLVRAACGGDFTLVIPGIRPAGASLDDQKRVMTPAKAAQAGADFIVVGRPVYGAADPAAAAAAINAELKGCLP